MKQSESAPEVKRSYVASIILLSPTLSPHNAAACHTGHLLTSHLHKPSSAQCAADAARTEARAFVPSGRKRGGCLPVLEGVHCCLTALPLRNYPNAVANRGKVRGVRCHNIYTGVR